VKVQQFFLRNVRSIKELDLDFRDPVTGKPMSRIVLAGTNGSGKTTILECIFGLIRSFGKSELDFSYLENSGGHARLVLEPPSQASSHPWVVLFNMKPTSDDMRSGKYLQWEYLGEELGFEGRYGSAIEFYLNPDSFLTNASLVYLTHGRRLLPTSSGPIVPEENNPWAYRHESTSQWEGSVESYLVWQNYLDLEDRNKGVRADRFQRIANVINQVFDHKRLVGVERARVVVDVAGQAKHGLDDLSSGEQQIVLMLVEITRHIKQGGIVLLDEPEISLHPAWQRGLMAALDKVIEQYDAQVILATHSLEIATSVLPHEVISLNDLGLPPGKWEPEREVMT
jgi:predicted ATPase